MIWVVGGNLSKGIFIVHRLVYGFGGGVGEPNRGGCNQGCSFEKSLHVCVNLEWKI